MILVCIIYSIFLCSVIAFKFDGWTVTGYKPSFYTTYTQIIGHDMLIDIKSVSNKSDKNRWYFRSPLVQMPKLLSFTLTGYAGRFNKLNDNLEPVCVYRRGVKHVFPHIKFNGSTTHYYVQFIHHLWSPPLPESNELIHIEILGDWTQGNETVSLSNVLPHPYKT